MFAIKQWYIVLCHFVHQIAYVTKQVSMNSQVICSYELNGYLLYQDKVSKLKTWSFIVSFVCIIFYIEQMKCNRFSPHTNENDYKMIEGRSPCIFEELSWLLLVQIICDDSKSDHTYRIIPRINFACKSYELIYHRKWTSAETINKINL